MVRTDFFGDLYGDAYSDTPNRGSPWGARRLTSGSGVLGFVDEDKPYNQGVIDAVEVVANAPADAVLPDSFTKDNVKFGDFKKKHFKNGRYVSAQLWDDQFHRTHVYILDPRSIYSASMASEDYARLVRDGRGQEAKTFLKEEMSWEMLKLDPHAWMHTLDMLLAPNLSITPMPDFGKFWDTIRARYQWTDGKHVNARRLVLRSQALNQSLMPYNPLRLQEDGSFDFEHGGAPAVRLATSIDAKLVYDSGFAGDFPILFRGQQAKEGLVRALNREYELPTASDGLICDLRSVQSQQIQLAGVAAGLAQEMYANDQMRSDLPNQFAAVWLNGQRMVP